MAEQNKAAPDWLLERLVAGDLAPDEVRRVKALIALTSQSSRIEELRRSNETILAEHPPAVVALEISRRLAREGRARTFPKKHSAFALPWLAAGAATVVVAMMFPVVRNGPTSPPDTIRLKGLEPHLVIHKKTSAGAVVIKDGSGVLPGDVVQVSYVAAGYSFGMIASVDSKHAVTLHLPEEPGMAVNLTQQGEVALSHAFELDDTAGRERFVFVASQAPFSTHLVIDALRAGDALPSNLVTTELSLEKSLP